jgi:hypothetical protein
MATVVAPVETVDVSLVEQISKLEEALKVLKRTARQELKARRRRRGAKSANGQPVAKGETPEQLKAWHEEVRKVWDEMRKSDAKTPYKRAVAEASARRKGGAPAPVAAAAPVVEKKVSKKAAAAAPAPVEAEAPKKRAVKKASA